MVADIIPLRSGFDDRQIEIMRHTVAKDVPPAEFGAFLEVCKARQLNPFNREIYAIMRGNGSDRVMTIQVSIDGFRLLAERSGKYRGQFGPFYCGKDGMWKEEWLSNEAPVLAKVGIIRADFDEPIWAIARYGAYVQLKNGQPTTMWAKMPDILLSKCAEALAIRKTFPMQVAGLYVHEEMMQADNAPVVTMARVSVPSLKALYIKAHDAGLAVDVDTFYRFCSDQLGREINRDTGKNVTVEERQRIATTVDNALRAILTSAVVEDEAVTEEDGSSNDDGYVSMDQISQELAEQKQSA